MRIDINKLEALGIEVEIDNEENTISLQSRRHNSSADKKIRDACNLLDFSDMESDELMCVTYRIQMLKALKIASGLS